MIRPDTARLPRRFAPRNDKSGGFAPLNLCRDHCQSARRSLSAATDAIGVCYFNDSRYKSAVGAPPISHKNIPDAAASGISLSKKSFQTFSPNCFQNCKINFCSTILQFCRCGGLLNAKGNPDGFLSHFSSLRNLRLGSFFASPFRKNEMYRPASRTVHFEEKKEREREKKEKKHEKERGCDLWKTSDQGRGLSCSDGSSALADVVGSSFCTASSLLSNTMGRRNVLP